MRVAVVGSGIAGLSAAWLLSRDHEVTLFELHGRLGMDAHAVKVGQGDGACFIDVPMRVVYEGYYPNLTRMYRDVGVQLEPLEYSGTFSHLGGDTYLSYRNVRLGRLAIPALKGRRALRLKTVKIVADMVRFAATASRHLRSGAALGMTLETYLEKEKYTKAFTTDFLLPTMAGICTCSYQAVRAYPAPVVLGYFARGLFFSPVHRAVQGTADVVARLTRGVAHIRLGTPVTEVSQDEAGSVRVVSSAGRETFDHVVMGTQANQTLRILKGAQTRELQALESFRYERSTVLMHTDARLAPQDRTLWGPVNFLLSPAHDMPMATIWMNTVYPALTSQQDVFQTWNPVLEPDADKVISRVSVERPVVDAASERGTALLQELHMDPARRIWFCGAYARPGVPLLESASSSGLAAASTIGGRHDWAPAP